MPHVVVVEIRCQMMMEYWSKCRAAPDGSVPVPWVVETKRSWLKQAASDRHLISLSTMGAGWSAFQRGGPCSTKTAVATHRTAHSNLQSPRRTDGKQG